MLQRSCARLGAGRTPRCADSRSGDGSAGRRELAHALAQRLLSRAAAAIGVERSGDLRQPLGVLFAQQTQLPHLGCISSSTR